MGNISRRDSFQSHNVGHWSRHSESVIDYVAGYFCDVRDNHHLPAYGGTLHSDQFHAAMGAHNHICAASPLFQRDHKSHLPERHDSFRSVGTIHISRRYSVCSLPRSRIVLQEKSLTLPPLSWNDTIYQATIALCDSHNAICIIENYFISL